MKNKNLYFDAEAFEKFSRGLERTAQSLSESVKALRAEGLDVSVAELSTYPKRFDDFNTGEGWTYRRHFRKLFEEAAKRVGWLPNAERERMEKNFMDVANRTAYHAQNITGIFDSGYVFQDTPEGAVLDKEATEEARRSDFFYEVDADAMAEHWKLMNELRAKVSEFNNFNLCHNLPPIAAPGLYDFGAFCGFVLSAKDREGNVYDMTEEQHNERVWERFRVKN